MNRIEGYMGLADTYDQGESVAVPDMNDPGAFCARISGDAMAPKYAVGELVIFSSMLAMDGEDCFVRFRDGHTTFRRYFPRDDGTVRLEPINPAHVACVVKASEIRDVHPAAYRFVRVIHDPPAARPKARERKRPGRKAPKQSQPPISTTGKVNGDESADVKAV